MEVQTFTGLTHMLQTVAIAALVFAACVYLPKTHHSAQLAKLPAFHNAISSEKHRQEYLKSAKRMYKEGYEKVSSLLARWSYLTDELEVQRLGLEDFVRRRNAPSRDQPSLFTRAEKAPGLSDQYYESR
jgi:hypothetical protein